MLPSDQKVALRHQVAQRRWFWIALIVLTGLALLLRLYRLDRFPAGLFWDESFEGLDAYSLFGKPFWHWPLFFTAINGREPLFVYLVHFAQRLWGPSAWSVRVVSATAGALLTPAMVWLGWEVAPALSVNHRKQFALWSGFAVLALLWSQTIARLGQRMSLFVLLEILFFAALWRAWRVPKPRWWILAGIFAGLSFYTYLAVRVIPLLLAIMLGYAFFCRRAQLRGRWQGVAISVAAALIVAMPLLIHFVRYPGDFSVRTNQVSIVNTGGIPMLLDNLGRVMGMAFVRGDLNDRLNYPGRPVLDVFSPGAVPCGHGLCPQALLAARQFFLTGRARLYAVADPVERRSAELRTGYRRAAFFCAAHRPGFGSVAGVGQPMAARFADPRQRCRLGTAAAFHGTHCACLFCEVR